MSFLRCDRGILSLPVAAWSSRDIIITGATTPPMMIEPDEDALTHAFDPIGEVSVSFTRE